jgi:dipicolinate synthase subunit A
MCVRRISSEYYEGLVLGTKRIVFIGGDARMLFAARAFAEDGFCTSVCGFDLAESADLAEEESAEAALAAADIVVLPPVVSRDGENVHAPLSSRKIPLSVLDIGSASMFCGASCPPPIKARAKNYAAREDFAVKNAVPTAEGALKIAMEETGESICGMRACVLGFGRIGAVLARDIVALGGRACVFARRAEARALAQTFGADACSFDDLGAQIGSYDCIFNTVPERIVSKATLAGIKSGAPFIELASAPGGADPELAREGGVRFIPAGGLPGKIMPNAAGKIVYETIKEMIREEEKI